MKDRFLPAGVGKQKASWERKLWRVAGMQVCGGRPAGRRPDLGGNLRARATLAHIDILLPKWKTKDSMGIPLAFSNIC